MAKNKVSPLQRSLFGDSSTPSTQNSLFDQIPVAQETKAISAQQDTTPQDTQTASEPQTAISDTSDTAITAENENQKLLKRLNSMTIAELEAEVIFHNKLYNAGTPRIDDLVYDQLVQRLRDVSKDSHVADALTSPDVSTSSKGKVVHEVPMLSIHKPDIRRVFEEIENWLTKFDGDVIATPKIDGLACSIEYDAYGDLKIASTRGNGSIGENITANVRYIMDIPKHIDFPNLEVRGEVYMPLDAFNAFPGDKISARNLAVGGLKQKDARETAHYHLSFFAYEAVGGNFKTDMEKFSALEKLGFITPEHHLFTRHPDTAQMRATLEHFCHQMTEQRDSWNFDADGIVLKVDDNRVQKDLGNTDHHPRCAIAYKFPCMKQESILREVRWQVAKGARITPVAIFDTVELAGAMVQKATLSNAGMVENFPTCECHENGEIITKHLKIGSRVLVSRRGDVIPHIEHIVSQSDSDPDVAIPCICPSCGGPAKRDGLFLLCSNPDECPATGQALIENYTKVTGCMGFGEKIIENLYDCGLVETPADLYKLTVQNIAQAIASSDDGTIDPDAIMPAKLYDSIQNTRNLTLAAFLESLSIPSLGKVNANKLAKSFNNIQNILNADANDFIPDVGGKAVDEKDIEDKARNTFSIIHNNITTDSVLTDALFKRLKLVIKERKQLLDTFSTAQQLLDADYATIYNCILEARREDRTARAIHGGLTNRRAVIDELLQYVTITDVSTAAAQPSENNAFAGKSFLFTGTLEHMKRDVAEKRVEALGGTISGSVTKTLSVLVATSQTSSKWEKAQKLNEKGSHIELWTEDDFIAALEKAES